MTDLARWLIDEFTGEARFSDIPREVHIAPGLRIAVPRQGVMLDERSRLYHAHEIPVERLVPRAEH